MVKILMVSHWEPWHIGGIEKVVSNISRALKNDFNIEIFCTGDKTYKRNWEDIPVHVFKGFTRSYRYSYKMEKSLRKADFNIIHAHAFTTHGAYCSARAKKNKIFIFNPHFHEIGSTTGYRILRKIYDPLIGEYILKKADKIICVSNTEKNTLHRRFKINSKKITIIPNGVNIERVKSANPFDFDGKLLLYVGRFEKYKNIHLIIQILRYLPKEYKLYIIGDGPYKPNLERQINNLGLSNRVMIITDVSDNDVYRWMKTCSVFITLSNLEAFGMTVIEALAAQKPVIINNNSEGLSELAEKFTNNIFGIDINKISKKELADFIVKKIDLKIDVELKEYTWSNIAKKVSNIYKEYDV